jgi:enamine deaminase RidA (YjgF/YER057c/UK114 family)
MSLCSIRPAKNTRTSVFETLRGATEYFIHIDSEKRSSFPQELTDLDRIYSSLLKEYQLNGSLVFSRFYLSDIANQKPLLRESGLFQKLQKGAVSVIQQCPLNGGNLSLLVYHIKSTSGLQKKIYTFDAENRRNGVFIQGDHYQYLWIANFCGMNNFDADKHTREIFTSFNSILHDHNMTLKQNVLRTWVYVRDIDNHYMDMVKARKTFFKEQGLDETSRYPASTGIEGFSREVNSIVAFDALALQPASHKQIIPMQALDHMPPTIRYGVTFERGMCVQYGDRSHLHVSGTASIDPNGEITHVNDVYKQTLRTLDNIRALLEPFDASLSDMAYLIVYVRNPKDEEVVRKVIETEISDHLPFLLLVGAVCRPAWLVEIEGMAILPKESEYPVFF